MRLLRVMTWLFVFIAGTATLSAAELPARPVPADFALRDAWVTEHFPKGQHGTHAEAATAPVPQSTIVVLNSYDLVFLNEVPGKGLAIADQKFAHGVYCHAPTRLKVVLAHPAKSLSSSVGVLTNPDSQGGSIIFSVSVGETDVYTSPVMHRGEKGVLATVDLRGAREFVLRVDDAADGIASDQGVWGHAVVTLEDGSEVRLGDLPLRHGLACERTNPTLPFSFLFADQPSDEFLKSWRFAEVTDESESGLDENARTPILGRALSSATRSSSTEISLRLNGR